MVVDADQALAGAVAWPPPDHPEAATAADPPALAPWVPGAWLVETAAGRWWVIEAYGSVSPADDLARRSQASADLAAADADG